MSNLRFSGDVLRRIKGGGEHAVQPSAASRARW